MFWKDFMSFRRMITPVIIQIVFWIGFSASIIGGIIAFFAGIVFAIKENEPGLILSGLIGGPSLIIIGIVLTRVFCESALLVFRMNETLTDIKNLLGQRQG